MAIVVLITYCTFLAAAVLWATTTSSRADAASSSTRTRPANGHAREHCPGARRAVVRYRAITWEWQDKRKARHAGATPTARGSCVKVLRAVQEWRARAAKARARFHAWWRYEYAWWLWLPSNWRQLGACETGYGRQPGDWTWDSGRYVSFAGIYRPAYADDAHRVGNLSWDETKAKLHRLPTPREQYDAAESHLRANGDGWGCPGP